VPEPSRARQPRARQPRARQPLARQPLARWQRPRGRGWLLIPAAAAGALALTVSGCARIDAALGKQWAVVQFSSSATTANVLQVRSACSHVPNLHPAPLPTDRSVLNMMNAVRYDTSQASTANIAELQSCLQRFKTVTGINFEDATDDY
jgi:hypothetical protein